MSSCFTGTPIKYNKDEGNQQLNSLIPIALGKKKKINRVYRQQSFVSVKVPVKINSDNWQQSS